MYLQKWPQTNKRKELQLLWIVISWWMGMPVKSHFATRHISSVRLFVFPLIDHFQTLTSWSATQSIRQHSHYYRYNICVIYGIRATSKPATIRGTNFVMVLKQECCACCRKREATPLLEQRLWLPASREVAGRRRTTGTEQLVYPGAGKSLTRKCLLPYSGPEYCFVKYLLWGLHSNEYLGEGRPTRDPQPPL